MVNKLGSDKAILAVVLVCSILTYGGVSLFVVAHSRFIRLPKTDQSRTSAKTFDSWCHCPRFIYLHNDFFTRYACDSKCDPIPYYGTNAFAAPILSIIGSLVMFGLGMLWLRRSAAKAKLAGEGYGIHADDDDIHADKLDTHTMYHLLWL